MALSQARHRSVRMGASQHTYSAIGFLSGIVAALGVALAMHFRHEIMPAFPTIDFPGVGLLPWSDSRELCVPRMPASSPRPHDWEYRIRCGNGPAVLGISRSSR